MKRVFGFALASVLFAASLACNSSRSAAPSQPEKPQPVTRPAIVGVAHIGLRTDNLAAARKFYGGVLGFQEPFTVDDPPGKLLLTYFKVNDHQYIEVFPPG
jgi:lactoylglutathione lyase